MLFHHQSGSGVVLPNTKVTKDWVRGTQQELCRNWGEDPLHTWNTEVVCKWLCWFVQETMKEKWWELPAFYSRSALCRDTRFFGEGRCWSYSKVHCCSFLWQWAYNVGEWCTGDGISNMWLFLWLAYILVSGLGTTHCQSVCVQSDGSNSKDT